MAQPDDTVFPRTVSAFINVFPVDWAPNLGIDIVTGISLRGIRGTQVTDRPQLRNEETTSLDKEDENEQQYTRPDLIMRGREYGLTPEQSEMLSLYL